MNVRMTRRKLWTFLFAAISTARVGAQEPSTSGTDRYPLSPRLGLPFATEPDRLPGPPRAVGELPQGLSQPPSTLPGRLPGQPARGMGEAPDSPSVNPDFPRFIPRLSSPLFANPIPTYQPPIFFTLPNQPGLPSTPRPGPGQLPPAIPEGTAPPLVRPPARADDAGALRLEEVLGSAERGYPPFLAVLQERGVAAGYVLSSEGAFDLGFNSDTRNYPLGYYNRSVHDVFFEQPLADLGGKVFAGYRLAQGRWPTYYNYLNTRSGGAFVAGLELPLLRNREIDPKRAKLLQAQIEQRKVEPTILKSRIDLFKNATKAYWNWVAAGRSLEIYRELVRVAHLRNEGLDRQAREGLVRAIDLVDFRKIVISREQQEVAARRRLEQAAIELSLFYRDARCLPTMPEAARLPFGTPLIEPIDPSRFEDDVQVALRLRPEILSIRLQARKAQVERRLAENGLLPSLSLYIYTEQNIGNRAKDLGSDFRPFIMESSLLFDVPLQRRAAKGRIITTDAEVRQIAIQGQFTGERVRADVLDAQSGLLASRELLERARENLLVSERLQEAERTLLREGSSNVLFLNLREQATSDAEVYVIEAEAKFLSSLADYRGALGLDAVMPGRPTPAPGRRAD